MTENRVNFHTVVELFNDELVIQFSLPASTWEDLSETQRSRFMEAESEQVRDKLNVYTEVVED